ncbi:MAG: hypothetical protein IJ298_10660 [Ruminococcus sp.]|nr:hypothetical protein [Ruminococcus sp.]
MTGLFFSILEISITAGLVALAVMFLRLVFKGTPRWISCLLWALVALRLLCPFAIESKLSLIPELSLSQESQLPEHGYVTSVKPITQTDTDIPQNVTNTIAQEESASVDAGTVLAIVWLCGMGAMALYGGASYMLTRRRVRESIPLKDNIRLSESVSSPFILGVLRPFIYIPFTLDKRTQKYVLAHEQAHLKRLDHIWKPLGFVLLCVHWFNPLMWVSYVLLCRDIEVACDERVIRDYSLNKRKDYARALLDCKVSQGRVAACPLAFGEVGVSERIKKTLKYKKTATAIVVTAVVITLLLSVGLLTDPVSGAETHYYESSYSRVTEGYEKLTELSVTEPSTEPATEPPVTELHETEVSTEAEVYEDYYTDDYYYDYADDYSDEYSDIEVREIPKLPLTHYEIVWNSTHTSWTFKEVDSSIDNSDSSSDNISDITEDSHYSYGEINTDEPIEVITSPDASSNDSPFGDRSSGTGYKWIVP